MFYRVQKIVVCVLFIIGCLLVFDVLAMNPFDELKGGEVTFKGVCHIEGKCSLPCVEVTNNKKVYIVFFDDKGEVALFQKIHDKFVLLWSRGSI